MKWKFALGLLHRHKQLLDTFYLQLEWYFSVDIAIFANRQCVDCSQSFSWTLRKSVASLINIHMYVVVAECNILDRVQQFHWWTPQFKFPYVQKFWVVTFLTALYLNLTMPINSLFRYSSHEPLKLRAKQITNNKCLKQCFVVSRYVAVCSFFVIAYKAFFDGLNLDSNVT